MNTQSKTLAEEVLEVRKQHEEQEKVEAAKRLQYLREVIITELAVNGQPYRSLVKMGDNVFDVYHFGCGKRVKYEDFLTLNIPHHIEYPIAPQELSTTIQKDRGSITIYYDTIIHCFITEEDKQKWLDEQKSSPLKHCWMTWLRRK